MLSYYSKSQIDGFLAGKSDVTHSHDEFSVLTDRFNDLTNRMGLLTELVNAVNISGAGSYYNKTQIDALMAGKSDIGHTHDFSAIYGGYDDALAVASIDLLLSDIAVGSHFIRIVSSSGEVSFVQTGFSGNITIPDADTFAPGAASADTSTDGVRIILPTGGHFKVGTASTAGISFSTAGNVLGDSDLTASGFVIGGTLYQNSFDLDVAGKTVISKRTGGQLVINPDLEFTTIDIQGSGVEATSFNTISARSAKESITAFKDSAIDILKNIDVVSFNYIGGDTKRVGLIADDAPALVSGSNHDKMDVANVMGLVASAVQELLERSTLTYKIIGA